jgi:ankyrin repeat protein
MPLILGTFAKEVVGTLLALRLLDEYFRSLTNKKPMVLPPFAAAYLERRVMNEHSDGFPALLLIRTVIERLHQENFDGRDIHWYLKELCPVVLNTRYPQSLAKLWKLSKVTDASDIDSHIYVAAIYTQTIPVIERWIASGKHPNETSWLFGSVFEYAARNSSEDFLAKMVDHPTIEGAQGARLNMLSAVAEAGRAQATRFVFCVNINRHPWEFSREKRPLNPCQNEWVLDSIDTPSREVFEFLMEKRKEHCINRAYDAKKYTQFLRVCIRKGWADMAACYLHLGAAVDGIASLLGYEGQQKLRPLIDACNNGHQDVVKVLLKYGADASAPALECAAGKGHLGIVRLLLEHEAEFGDAVERAVARGYRDVVEELLDHGGDVQKSSGDLLVHAVRYEHVTMFRLLVERGCNPHKGTTMARCAWAAEEEGLESMLEILREV